MATKNYSRSIREEDSVNQGHPVSRGGTTTSPIKRSNAAAYVLSTQMQGVDPTQIVGADHMIPTEQDRNAFGSPLPVMREETETPLTARELRHIDGGPPFDPSSQKPGKGPKGSNPFAGMGDF